ncbi:hypothetical protein GCM10011368_33980 [Hyunsoonleella pacifica]|nr:hypothetical protein GCM10011368_33980 [Hyunsoonleella pacifica]
MTLIFGTYIRNIKINRKNMYLAIGPSQLILVLVVPVVIFLLGFFIGKKSGYIKRVKETENRNNKTN